MVLLQASLCTLVLDFSLFNLLKLHLNKVNLKITYVTGKNESLFLLLNVGRKYLKFSCISACPGFRKIESSRRGKTTLQIAAVKGAPQGDTLTTLPASRSKCW